MHTKYELQLFSKRAMYDELLHLFVTRTWWNDRKIFFLELKNKLDNGGFDGTDLYDKSKIINKRIQADFLKVTLELFYAI